MRFACLVRCEARDLEVLSKAEADAFTRECLEYDEALEAKGQLLLAQALQPPEATVTVRVRNGKISTTDGPFAETKEQVGGIVLIQARDLSEAVQVAARSPFARLGCVEVRPIMEASSRWPTSRGGRRGMPAP
jgi:hypothetical protein